MPQGVWYFRAASFLYRHCIICDSFLPEYLLLVSHLIPIFVLISNYLKNTYEETSTF